MGAILKKEFKAYFLTPVGYVFIGLFLILFSMFFNIDVLADGFSNFEYIFYSGASLLTFIVPILTMRTFAEERKTGTEQLILTSPVSILKIVLAKFIAAMLVILVTELCTLMYFGILCYFGKPHLLTALTTLFGFFLLAMAYVSFGIFASSITENQIIAGVITIGFFMFSWFLPDLSPIFSGFSLINLLTKFLVGQIDITAVVSLVSFTLMCLLLTIIFIQRRKSVR